MLAFSGMILLLRGMVDRRSQGGRLRRNLVPLLAVAGFALAGLAIAKPAALSELAFLQATETAADEYFRALGAPPGAGRLTDFRRHDLDGMQNADASGSYAVSISAESVLRYYSNRCRQLGLGSPAAAETRAYYPHALCDGAVIVTVTRLCKKKRCTAFVEVIGA